MHTAVVGRSAGFVGLGNLIMFYDSNDIQLSSEVIDVMHEDTAKKYESWGWHVQTIGGNNADQIRVAITVFFNDTSYTNWMYDVQLSIPERRTQIEAHFSSP